MIRVSREKVPPAEWKGCSVAIGNFDGVHAGHRELLKALREMGARHGGPGLAMTFDPHPVEVVGGKVPERLLPVPDRVSMLLACGADAVWVVPFDREFAGMAADVFFEEVLVGALAAQGVVVGPDFRFGAARRGDDARLALLAARFGLELRIVVPVEVDGRRVSSSAVRAALKRGDVEAAARMLGRYYRVKGSVVQGERLGTRIGFPTANVAVHEQVLYPAEGVYIVRLRLGPRPLESRVWEGVASIGCRPTVGGQEMAVEVHLFEMDRPLYGEEVTVEFLRRLRGQERFADLGALRAAIAADVERAKSFFLLEPRG